MPVNTEWVKNRRSAADRLRREGKHDEADEMDADTDAEIERIEHEENPSGPPI